ncbi:hypothetical protein F5Y00DRAFT_176923 [Daldinia vernicosa]|uniref:uncharacterized protein n=1 Tax=Daldinia vernicosa TaxID=114800 RepID=UPI0020080ECD|nr:uncharacterized protein F5Y00DRAFT_176923 [Daldinia vernicosa]KAI0852620.1 hypothetical protein F5Y00DRAFT_176923 [Daldinia vernicosa]
MNGAFRMTRARVGFGVFPSFSSSSCSFSFRGGKFCSTTFSVAGPGSFYFLSCPSSFSCLFLILLLLLIILIMLIICRI